MEQLLITISTDLAKRWPFLIERAGCLIDNIQLYTQILSGEFYKGDLRELTLGSSDYRAIVACPNAKADLAFIKSASPGIDGTCVVLPRGSYKYTSFLVRSLNYMLMYSGGTLYSSDNFLVKNTYPFRATPGIVKAFLEAIHSRQICATTEWTSDGAHRLDESVDEWNADPFRLMHLRTSEACIEVWFGPALLSGDSAFGTFITILFKQSWWRHSKQSALFAQVTQILAEISAQKIDGFVRSLVA